MRLTNWRNRLEMYLAEMRRAKIAPGRVDCALFAAGGVKAVTGVDPAAEWRGHYRSFEAGLRLVRKAGFIDHIDAARYKFRSAPVAKATLGDLAVVPTPDGDALGIVAGRGDVVMVLRLAGGLGTVDLLAATEILEVR